MYRIFGLGNIGLEYEKTPHNIGKEILEKIQKNNSLTFFNSRYDKKRKAEIFQGNLFGEKAELVFFDGFMNNSGDVFNGVFSKENENEKEKIIIIHDDVDLPFGEIRISFNRGDGGHNGLKDIFKKLKTKKIIRIRIGVCPLDFFGKCRKPKAGQDLNNYLVYKKLGKKYLNQYQKISEKVEKIIETIIKENYQKAMNKFN